MNSLFSHRVWSAFKNGFMRGKEGNLSIIYGYFKVFMHVFGCYIVISTKLFQCAGPWCGKENVKCTGIVAISLFGVFCVLPEV